MGGVLCAYVQVVVVVVVVVIVMFVVVCSQKDAGEGP